MLVILYLAHIINSERRKEGNVLFNDALNTFYLRLYGVGHMVKDHSDSGKGNPLPPHGLLFTINSKGYFIYVFNCMARVLINIRSSFCFQW